jgi:hypothetical protein
VGIGTSKFLKIRGPWWVNVAPTQAGPWGLTQSQRDLKLRHGHLTSYEPQVPPAPETPPSWKRSQFCPFIAELHAPGKISTVNPQTQVITWVPILSSAAVFVLIWDCGINESLSKFILFINFFIFLDSFWIINIKNKF